MKCVQDYLANCVELGKVDPLLLKAVFAAVHVLAELCRPNSPFRKSICLCSVGEQIWLGDKLTFLEWVYDCRCMIFRIVNINQLKSWSFASLHRICCKSKNLYIVAIKLIGHSQKLESEAWDLWTTQKACTSFLQSSGNIVETCCTHMGCMNNDSYNFAGGVDKSKH
jgi:hypothetical protein